MVQKVKGGIYSAWKIIGECRDMGKGYLRAMGGKYDTGRVTQGMCNNNGRNILYYWGDKMAIYITS